LRLAGDHRPAHPYPAMWPGRTGPTATGPAAPSLPDCPSRTVHNGSKRPGL